MVAHGGVTWCSLLTDILPVAVPERIEMGGGAGDGFLDHWYWLGCELPVLYGLVPRRDVSVA